jgi:Delta7-sterol 5-desaturase
MCVCSLCLGQVAREIAISLQASFGLALIYLLPFWGIHKGYSMLYKDVTAYPLWYIPISIIFFFGFTEFCVYWAHRLLHHPKLYAPLHKLHHTNSLWATPFAAFSFESVDSAFQGISYVCVPFVFPIQYHLLYGLLFLLMAWAASIHDRVHMTDVRLFNDAGHHFVHHRDFVYNYGQYFTFMDRICGTYKDPFAEEDKTKAQ